MAEKVSGGTIAFRGDGRILFTSSCFSEALGVKPEQIDIGQNIWSLLNDQSLFDPPFDPNSQPTFQVALGEERVFSGQIVADDVWIAEVSQKSNGSGDGPSIVLDDLTGIPTRQGYRRAIDRHQAGLDGETSELIVIALDLDRFKRINDTLGHAAGDALLQKFVSRAQRIIRKDDGFFRIGGDEFVIVVVQDKGAKDAEEIAARLIERTGRPYLIAGSQVDITVSIGLVCADSQEQTSNDLLKKADIALFQSKTGGRARSTWFAQEMADEIAAKRKLEVELRRAMVLEQLHVQFEPQIYHATGEVHTLNSKIVWQHPEHGLLDEKAFLGVAESVGLVPELSRWQFNASLSELKTLSQDVEVSLPVRSSFLSEDGFVEFVEQIGIKHDFDLKRLCLEFSEATLLDNEAISGDVMLQLSQLGVRLSLGDFGSGLVALSYLRVLPFSEIKIDFSSALNWGDDTSQSAMATKIAELGSALGIRVLASTSDSKIIHTVLSEGAFSHIERIQVAAPVEAEKVGDFLEYLRSRSQGET